MRIENPLWGPEWPSVRARWPLDPERVHLNLGAHDEVLITDHAYGAVRYAVERACAKAGATVVVQPVPLPPSAEELSDAVLAGVTAHTRLAVVDQIASPTGLRFPVERLVVEL